MQTADQSDAACIRILPVLEAARVAPNSNSSLPSQVRQLVDQKQWDVRHGGLLGLKYLLAARADLGPQLLPEALPAALLGLKVSHAGDITPARAESGPPAATSAALTRSNTTGVLTSSGSEVKCALEQTARLMLCYHRLRKMGSSNALPLRLSQACQEGSPRWHLPKLCCCDFYAGPQ